MTTDQEKLDQWMTLCIEQKEEIARMRAALEEMEDVIRNCSSYRICEEIEAIVKRGLGL